MFLNVLFSRCNIVVAISFFSQLWLQFIFFAMNKVCLLLFILLLVIFLCTAKNQIHNFSSFHSFFCFFCTHYSTTHTQYTYNWIWFSTVEIQGICMCVLAHAKWIVYLRGYLAAQFEYIHIHCCKQFVCEVRTFACLRSFFIVCGVRRG